MATNDDLREFVRDALNRGVSRDEIRAVLFGAGWAEVQVVAALASFADVDFPTAVPRPRPSVSAREAFEYLVLFGTLYFGQKIELGQYSKDHARPPALRVRLLGPLDGRPCIEPEAEEDAGKIRERSHRNQSRLTEVILDHVR